MSGRQHGTSTENFLSDHARRCTLPRVSYEISIVWEITVVVADNEEPAEVFNQRQFAVCATIVGPMR